MRDHKCDLNGIVDAINTKTEFDYLKHQYYIFYKNTDFRKFMKHVDYSLDQYNYYRSIKSINGTRFYDKFNAKIYSLIDTIEGMIDDFNDYSKTPKDERWKK